MEHANTRATHEATCHWWPLATARVCAFFFFFVPPISLSFSLSLARVLLQKVFRASQLPCDVYELRCSVLFCVSPCLCLFSFFLSIQVRCRRVEARRRRRNPRSPRRVHRQRGTEAHAAEDHHQAREAPEASVARALDVA